MKSLNTEIISIGTELLLGHVTNTDTRDVAEALSAIGINVLWQTVVGDNPGRLRDCIEIAKKRADIIVTTGGLGPTCDDISKQLLAQSFGLELKREESEYERLCEYARARGRSITDNVVMQAYLPEGCTVFHNNCGTAPGCAFVKDGITVAMLPGPPKECRGMIKDSLVPYLKTLSDEVIVSHTVNVFGLGESGVDSIFRDQMNEMTNPSMAPYTKECDCLVKLTAKAKSEAEAEAMLEPFMEQVVETLGDYVYGTDVDSIEQRVLQLLDGDNRTLAFSEHFTGGDISARFSALEGSEKYLAASCVNGNAESLDADIVVDTSVDDRYVVTVVLTDRDGFRYEYKAPEMLNRNRSFMRHMAGNCAFDTIRRYLCSQLK